MNWTVLTASCGAILAGMGIEQMALIVAGLGGLLIAFVIFQGKRNP
jgi:hypothetical protein